MQGPMSLSLGVLLLAACGPAGAAAKGPKPPRNFTTATDFFRGTWHLEEALLGAPADADDALPAQYIFRYANNSDGSVAPDRLVGRYSRLDTDEHWLMRILAEDEWSGEWQIAVDALGASPGDLDELSLAAGEEDATRWRTLCEYDLVQWANGHYFGHGVWRDGPVGTPQTYQLTLSSTSAFMLTVAPSAPADAEIKLTTGTRYIKPRPPKTLVEQYGSWALLLLMYVGSRYLRSRARSNAAEDQLKSMQEARQAGQAGQAPAVAQAPKDAAEKKDD